MVLSIPFLVVKFEGPGELAIPIASALFGLSFITVTMTILVYTDPGLIIQQKEANVHLNEYIHGKPVLETYCEVFEGKYAPWLECVSRDTIWREKKSFEYTHWIDATDETAIESMKGFKFLLFDFEVRFADNTTERAYDQYLQTLTKELPAHCLDRNITTKNIISVCREKKGKLLVSDDNLSLIHI